jgi:hypothetical protein
VELPSAKLKSRRGKTAAVFFMARAGKAAPAYVFLRMPSPRIVSVRFTEREGLRR